MAQLGRRAISRHIFILRVGGGPVGEGLTGPMRVSLERAGNLKQSIRDPTHDRVQSGVYGGCVPSGSLRTHTGSYSYHDC